MKQISSTIFLFFVLYSISFSQTILNGSFENNTAVTSQINLTNPQFNSMMANCTGFGTYGDIDILTGNIYCDYPQNGNWYIAFTGSGTDMVAMELSQPLVQGNTYTLTFYDRGCSGWTPYPFDIGVSTSNNNFGDTVFFNPNVPAFGPWTLRTVTFIAPNNGLYITVTMNGGSTGDWGHVDNFVLTSSATAPIVALSSSDTVFCEKSCIDFFDQSTNSPTSWQWFFPGADSTSSTVQNPSGICYSSYGSFDVTLIACNAVDCDTLVMTNFITEYQTPTAIITQSADTLYSSPGWSYQWFTVGGGLIPGATQNFYVTTLVGNYFVLITDSDGCESTSNVISITTGLQNVSDNGALIISPNPFNSALSISINQNFDNANLAIRNVIGQTVYQNEINNKESEINLEFLPKGIYLIEIVVNEKRLIQQIVKE